MSESFIGKYVVVRCKDAGVHAGILESFIGRQAVLHNSRRLYYWKPADGHKFLSGVAFAGLSPGCKIGAPVDIILTEDCEIILCSKAAAKSICDYPIDKA